MTRKRTQALPRYEGLYRQSGHRIRDARVRAGISQTELARRVGLTRTSITNIEAGKQHYLLDTLYAIAEVLGISVFQLLPGKTMDEVLESEKVITELRGKIDKIRDLLD